MKVLAIAANTLQGLIRNRLVLVFFLVYLGLLLVTLSPLLFLRQHTNAANAQDSASFFLLILRGLVTMTTSAGSFFAMVGGAYAVAGEIQSGTILGVMARPLARWEFLAGSYLGVQGLLWIYLTFMLAFEEVLSLIARQHIVTSWWILAVYPLIRYMLYSAIAVFFATFLGPFVAVGATLLVTIGAMLLEGNGALSRLPHAFWWPRCGTCSRRLASSPKKSSSRSRTLHSGPCGLVTISSLFRTAWTTPSSCCFSPPGSSVAGLWCAPSSLLKPAGTVSFRRRVPGGGGISL
jgi:hypothetical protein